MNSGNEITVTNMPEVSDYKQNDGTYREYFHPFSGLRNGTWAYNGGTDIKEKMLRLYRAVYGFEPNSLNNYLNNLYGAKVSGTSQYHIGVDINAGKGTAIHPVTDGTIIYCADNALGIYDSENNITWYYLHMSGRPKVSGNVYKDDIIGYEDKIGWATGYHLHIEIYEGRHTTGPNNPPTLSGTTNALCPYPYF